MPYEDLTAEHLPHFLVMRLGSLLPESDLDRSKTQFPGVVGLEPCGRDGLLRSLAVAPAYRGQGLGGGARWRTRSEGAASWHQCGCTF